MVRYLVFGRHEYAEPLEHVGDVEAPHEPTLADVGVGDDWLELVVFPAADAIWVLREASLVDERKGVPT